MKMKRFMCLSLVTAGFSLGSLPAMAADSYIQTQYNQISSNVPGISFGYTQANTFKVGVPVQQNVQVQNELAGLNYDFQNTNLVGVSGGVGVAVGIQGKTVAVDVNTAQAMMVH